MHAFLSNMRYGSWGHWIKNHKNYLLNKDSQVPREPMEKELAQSMDKSKTDGSRKQLQSAQASQALAPRKLNHTNFYSHHASCTITTINCPRFLMKWVGGRWDYRSNRIQTRICDFQGDLLLEWKTQHKLAEQNEKEKNPLFHYVRGCMCSLSGSLSSNSFRFRKNLVDISMYSPSTSHSTVISLNTPPDSFCTNSSPSTKWVIVGKSN